MLDRGPIGLVRRLAARNGGSDEAGTASGPDAQPARGKAAA